MHNDPTRDPGYLSQSECRTAQDCGTKWLAEWYHGVRPSAPESPAQRIGSIGHAILEEHLMVRHEGGEVSIIGAVVEECEKRGYDLSLDDPEVRRAEQAAETLLSSPKFAPGTALLTSDGRAMIEHRLRATWDHLRTFSGLDISPLTAIFAGHRLGMEGQPDFVHERRDLVLVDDFKFRQKIDLGGAVEQSGLPDPQGAYYKILLGGVTRKPVVFRQINVYAGEWLTLDDFLCEGSAYITKHGIPSRDLKVLGMVTPQVWEEAWRTLVERRRVASTHAVTTTAAGKPRKPNVRLASEAEQRDAADFLDTLRRIPLVEVSEFRLDHSVCIEVVRDMLAAVAGHLALLRAGAHPGRHLRTYHNSPCARRYGCAVQDACLASLGTFRLDETLRDMAEDGRLRREFAAARAVEVGDHDVC